MGKNKYDEQYDRGKDDAESGRRSERPCDEHAWKMFKSEKVQDDEYKQNRSYEAGYEDGSDDSKGGCFVTTACVEHAKLADDCFEMQMSRRLRDEFLLKSAEGQEFVRWYRRNAPLLVERTKNARDSNAQFSHALIEIRRAAEMVAREDFGDAFLVAKSLMSKLSESDNKIE